MVTPRGRTYSRATAGDVYGGRFAPSSAAFAAALPALGWSGSASISAPAIPPSNKYRNAQPYLFNSISAPVVPDRLGGPPGFDMDISQAFGPMRSFVDWNSGWRWLNDGGDWIDSADTAMGNAPWGSVATPAAGAAATYAVTVTTALQRVQTTGRWNAWIVRRAPGATAARTWAGRFNSTPAYRPRIDVTYTDASTATLACRVSAYTGLSTSQPSQGAETFTMNAAAGVGVAALEFDLPTKVVASATLYFTVTNHWSAACTLEFNLADPPLNTSPVTTGVADAYPLDEGLSAAASIMGVHRYMDATDILDYWQSITVNTDPDKDWNFSADVGGVGPNDATMLPRKGAGKFVPANLYGGGFVSLVDSSYSADSFTPLAPGMGAMRFTMPKASGITDGWAEPGNGTATVNAYIHMPVDKIDVLDHLFVRYYQMIGTTADTGNPYRADVSKKYEVLRSESLAAWIDMGGKFSISPCGKTPNGGNSGSSGSGRGWVLRPHWFDYWADSVSPGVGGWQMDFEWDDFQSNPAGYNYNVNVAPGFLVNKDFCGWGQKGGLASVFYAGRWYCIEEEIKLNSVATVNAQDGRYWQPDGEVRVWVDGRLVYEVTGVVMRTLPADPTAPGLIQIKPGGSGATQLGIKHLWFNWFHGGTTSNSIDRVAFITGLAWGTSRIGPMKLPSAVPDWVPPAGELATLTVANGGLASNWRAAVSPNYSPFYSRAIVNDYAGAVKNPHWGSYGATMWFGSGHASGTNDNSVIVAEYGQTGIEFKRIVDPTNWVAAGGQNEGGSPDISALVAFPWLESTIDGKPLSPHSWQIQCIVGPGDGGATYGTLWQAFGAAQGQAGYNAVAAHKLPLTSMAANTATWARASATSDYPANTSAWGAPLLAVPVPAQQRIYLMATQAPAATRWLDMATGLYVTGSGTGIDYQNADNIGSGVAFFVPSRNLIVCVMRRSGTLAVRWMDVSVSQPTMGSAVTLSMALPTAAGWSTATWCPHNNRIIVAGITGNTDAMYEIEIPATLTDTWQVTRAPLGSGQTFVPDDVVAGYANSFNKFQYDEKVRAIVYLGRVQYTGDDAVMVYKPRNT